MISNKNVYLPLLLVISTLIPATAYDLNLDIV